MPPKILSAAEALARQKETEVAQERVRATAATATRRRTVSYRDGGEAATATGGARRTPSTSSLSSLHSTSTTSLTQLAATERGAVSSSCRELPRPTSAPRAPTTTSRRTSMSAASTATSSLQSLPRIAESRVVTSEPAIPLRASTLSASALTTTTPFRPPAAVTRRPLRPVPTEANERSRLQGEAILKVGDQKLHASKELLARHSPVFEAMLFGEFAGPEEVELTDVVVEELKDLLQTFESKEEITDRTVLHILKLADRFQMKMVIALSEKHLMQSDEFGAMKKLLLADQYGLVKLQDHCLKSLTSVADILLQLKAATEFEKFSDGMRAAICTRIVELMKN